MVKVTFKNVGQGDSIIIEWVEKSINKIGIIDCNLFYNSNPTLEYISSAGYSEIEFIILSHPHYDHFSGLLQLLEYCDANNILILRFLHTAEQVPDFLRVATRSVISDNELVFLFKKIAELRKKEIIGFVTYISDDIKDIHLTENLWLRFLAPSSFEKERFLRGTPLFDEEDPHNNSQSNWLSTIIKVYTPEWYILFTSDTTIETLKRVGIKLKSEFSTKLLLGQSPHHGAKANHYDGFWKTKNHDDKTPIVFSVGPNIYNHPSDKAVSFFGDQENGYMIFSTNQVGSLNAFRSTPLNATINSYLNLVGNPRRPQAEVGNQYSGEKTFIF